GRSRRSLCRRQLQLNRCLNFLCHLSVLTSNPTLALAKLIQLSESVSFALDRRRALRIPKYVLLTLPNLLPPRSRLYRPLFGRQSAQIREQPPVRSRGRQS